MSQQPGLTARFLTKKKKISFPSPPENTVFILQRVRITPCLTPSRGKASRATGDLSFLHLPPASSHRRLPSKGGGCATQPGNPCLTSQGAGLIKQTLIHLRPAVKKGDGVSTKRYLRFPNEFGEFDTVRLGTIQPAGARRNIATGAPSALLVHLVGKTTVAKKSQANTPVSPL